MITDAETNFVYFSELLRQKPDYRLFHEQLISILQKHNIQYNYLDETRDIWCRDYMPIQVNKERFVEFRYDPDYLLNFQDRSSKTYPDIVCDSLALKTLKSDIVLDGGNVIRGRNCVILTDKVLYENKLHYNTDHLIGKLSELFEVDKVILIPWDKSEPFGHADGMLRLIDDNHVLINGYFSDYNLRFKKAFFGALDKNQLGYTEIKFNVDKSDEGRNWGYINFLQMENLLIIPSFGIDEDDQALDQISQAFPGYANKGQIETLESNSIIQHGGVLNCVSWNISA